MGSETTSSIPAFRVRWDVFLSFRGEDTRDGFTDHLYSALERSGVRVFRDNDALNRGDEIAPGLLDAIEDSAAAIAVISPDYASSRWCLEELAKICDCRRLILPVFYCVDPSDVRRQRGPFEDSFRSLRERFGEEVVARWRKAMEKAGGISGWVFCRNSSEEQELIRCLVKRVLTELSNTPLAVATYIVGLDSHVEKLMDRLTVKSGGIQVLGLHGIGGVGKTTLAKALYNKLVTHFEHRSFISNVRETSAQENGLVALQNKVINDLSMGKMLPVYGYDAGIIAIKRTVHEKQVLVVLDNVDDVSQLNALAASREWFCEGSRIIITTRNQEVLLKHQVDMLYEVKELDSSDSLKLFSYHALRREKPTEDFYSLSKQIVSLTGGLPLALEVFGSFLFDKRRVEEWKDALQKLQQIRPHHLQDLLKISFDGLDEQEKCMFLDIACLFVKMEMKRDYAIDVWKGCGFSAETAVNVLTAKSLIKITDDSEFWMHDQVRDMGRQIVHNENLVDPGMRSRLWNHDEILRVLEAERGSKHVEGIILDFENKNFVNHLTAEKIAWNEFWRAPNFASAVIYLRETLKKCFHHDMEEREEMFYTKPFESMVNLRLLQINHVKMEGSFKYMPAGLKWLQWKGCPLEILPDNFFPRELAVLDLSESKIKHLRNWRWRSSHRNQVARKLMVLNLQSCHNLISIPDLSGHQSLEKLILAGCVALNNIHKSVGDLNTLLHLNLRDCPNLVEFPNDVSGLKQLETLILSGCSKLQKLPENLSSMKSLREFLLDGTAIAKLPESIFRLTKLERLSLEDCQSLKQLPICIGKLTSLRELSLDHSALEEIPASIGSLKNLEKLNLRWCRSLTAIPDSVGNLKLMTEFLLNGSSVKELPASIGSLSYLKNLSVGECCSLGTLPVSIDGLASMVELQLDGTNITYLPDQIGALKMLEKLEMRNCRSLRSLPESIGSILTLTTLNMVGAAISELPESIGMLENLIFLRLNKCRKLCRLPASMGKLRSLCHLLMEDTAVRELPENFGTLSGLMILHMAKRPHLELPQNIGQAEVKILSGQETPELLALPTAFTNLTSLIELDARGWKISGKIPDDFEKLSSLEILNLGHNNFFSLPSSLRGLTILKKLLLPHCNKLKSLPPLPSSLQELNLAHCTALESIFDLSNLKNLWDLHLANCENLEDIPGLESLKSLRRLNMSSCSACSTAVKRRLSKDALKRFFCLSIPGSEIPDWFSEGAVLFSHHRNLAIRSVIIGVVVSLNEQTSDDSRFQLPIVAGIEAQILRLNKIICTVTLNLMGVPKMNEDQFYMCRYLDHQPLVFNLLDGDEIRVVARNPPIIKGVEVKKCGICLVYENDDDYDQDEDLLDDSQQTVSGKLENFFHPSEGVNVASTSACKV
ncbi:disease resistance protein RPV1-like isoform X1 [Malania oleifera]|uniref:disease resistance protein RPV1-like isoform X1 n=1 Tax=Malania oleifera TaxID=397392 RepID=UPI0025AEA016|nr:disease resistance protein RPV1-like isoform X1 [Malania oleifera]